MKKGLLVVITGKSKDITAPALGTVFRALGRGLRVCLIQFMKEPGNYIDALVSQWSNPMLETHTLGNRPDQGSGAGGQGTDLAREAWQVAGRLVSSGRFQLVVLDELTNLMKNRGVTIEEVVSFLNDRPVDLHVIVTGHDVPEPLIAAADMVTEMAEVK